MNLREYLKTTNLITDGAFGTYFAAKYQTQDIPELANITAPEKVKKIHEEYLNAGAKFIRTNTFASNKETLQEDFAEVEKNIQAAVEIARDAVNGRDAWIAGDIGPIPVNGAEDAAAAADEYYQIAKTFAERGVTVLDFETFADLDGILPAIKKICAEYEMFIMVSFSVNQFGYSAAGLSAKRLLADAVAVPEIDAVGLNCGVGPAHMRQILEKAGRPGDKFLLAIPNAGYPTLTRNKLQFGNTPVYFAEKMKELQEFTRISENHQPHHRRRLRNLFCRKIPDPGYPGADKYYCAGEGKEDPRGIPECRSEIYQDKYFCVKHRNTAGGLCGS